MDLVEGTAPSKMEKEIVHGVSGNVGAPATPRVTAPTVVCVCETEKENLHECEKKKPLDNCNNQTYCKLIRKPLGTSWP
jgi:hypothetical protein